MTVTAEKIVKVYQTELTHACPPLQFLMTDLLEYQDLFFYVKTVEFLTPTFKILSQQKNIEIKIPGSLASVL